MKLYKGTYKIPIKYSELEWQERREVREEYIKLQKGKCYYCRTSLSKEPPKNVTNKKINWKLFPENFLQYPVHLQHNHETDLTEGAVHSYCNAVMWQYEGK